MNIYENQKILDNKKYREKILYKKQGECCFLYNIFLSPFKRIYSRPLMIFCETTNVCNNECCICSYNKYDNGDRKSTIMPIELFEKILFEYSAIGGGKLSLTPHPGEVFLDKLLLKRLDLLRKYPQITGVSVTTNGFLPDWYSEDELKRIINSFERIMVSIYGVEREEHKILTNRDTYYETIDNINRLLSLIEDKKRVVFGFRLLKKHNESEISNWIFQNFSTNIAFGYTTNYTKWSNAIDTSIKLPMEAQWLEEGDNSTQCLRPLVAHFIYSNGDTIFCPCADNYKDDGLLLGNVKNNTLEKIFNSKYAKKLWNFEKSIPSFCRNCSIHIPLSQINEYEYIFENPINFIGG